MAAPNRLISIAVLDSDEAISTIGGLKRKPGRRKKLEGATGSTVAPIAIR
jgi:hypothetical protein